MFVRRNSTFDAGFFSVLSRLGNKRTVFWKKKEKKLIAAKSGLVGMKGYLEIYNCVKYFLRHFLSATSFTPNFWGVNSNVTTMKTLKIVPPSLSILQYVKG